MVNSVGLFDAVSGGLGLLLGKVTDTVVVISSFKFPKSGVDVHVEEDERDLLELKLKSKHMKKKHFSHILP